MQTDFKQLPDAADVFTIWPDAGIPPGAEKSTWHEQGLQPPGSSIANEMVRNVVIPTLTMFKPAAGTANGTALIVAPGGAFHFLMMYHEGYDVAAWLAQLGVTAFVLKYRIQHTPEMDADMLKFLERFGDDLSHPDEKEIDPPVGFPPLEEARLWAEEDGRQAIRYLRQHAAELSIDPNRIGIMGFSAGGGVAINAALKHDSLSYPNFVVGIYPAYRKVNPLPDDVPPLFLIIADDDALVAPISSARLYEDWHKAGQSVELHIFASGGHGFGLRKQALLSDQWIGLLKYWMVSRGYISQ